MGKMFVTDEKRGDGGAVMNWYGASMPGIARRKSLQAVTGCHRLFPPLLEGDTSVWGTLACHQGKHNNVIFHAHLTQLLTCWKTWSSVSVEDMELCLWKIWSSVSVRGPQ